MSNLIETNLYSISQLFLIPVLLTVIGVFFYAFYALGAFLWQSLQRRNGDARGFELLTAKHNEPSLTVIDLETLALKRLEISRLISRVAPMLGLVATMIPMGPALRSLADGQLQEVSANLMVAFSAVILSLIAASLTYWTVNVRRRWYATELAEVEHGAKRQPIPASEHEAVAHDPAAVLAAGSLQ